MEHTQSRLSHLQLIGSLLIVFLLAVSMSAYFLFSHWHDFSNRQAAISAQSSERAREHLKATSEQTVLMLGALREQASQTLKSRIREQANQAWLIAQSTWQREHGKKTDAEIGRQILDTLRPLRFHDGDDYFFVLGQDGRVLLHPDRRVQNAPAPLSLTDDTGHYVLRDLIATTQSPDGAGFRYYRWPEPGQTLMRDKIAYVRRFAPLNWIIGTGEFVASADTKLQQQGLDLLQQLQSARRDSFIVFDSNGILRMFPPDPAQVGRHFLALPPSDRALLVSLMGLSPSGGFLSCVFKGEHALAYARKLPGWGWTLVSVLPTQMLIDRDQAADQDLREALHRRVNATLLMTLLAMGLAGLFSWMFARWMNALFARYRRDLWASHHELKERSRELLLSRFMMDNASQIVCLMDQHARLAYQNEMARLILGSDPHIRDQRLAALFRPPEGPLPRTYAVALPEDKSARIFEVTLNEILYEGERYRSVTAHDITERMQAEDALRLAARVFETSAEAILIANSQNRILKVNNTFLESTGYSEAEVIGQTPSILASGRHSRQFYDEMWQILREHGKWSGEIWNRRKNGEVFPEWLTISVLTDERGKISHYVALFTDMSESKRQEAQMRYMAEYDPLTDLPNRARINDRMQAAIGIAETTGGELAVLFIDLDHFKHVNDSLGHEIGDALLKETARRLSQTLRDIDDLGRSGGDEFVLILPDLRRHEEAAQVAERILATLREPFELAGNTVHISASIGISLYPKDGRDIQGLMMSADLALYHAKASGRDLFRFYSSQMNNQFNERLMLESRLREALAQNQLDLVYQPLFAMDGHTLIGCEALLRWHHPEIGFIAPERFIPVAEETGLIEPLGAMVLDRVCARIAQWQQQGAAVLPVTVNISAGELSRPNLVETLRATLAKYRLSGDRLLLDMNEDALMSNPARAMSVLDRIRALGVGLAIDNFGVGYSSPAHLKRFAPAMIKIDRTFVAGLPDDLEQVSIVSAIVHLARALEIPTLAQGVETEAQRLFLLRMGCDGFQGFLAGAPQSADSMGRLWLTSGS
ncbi:bifunctional diguanylate cyclase/phosphodiesterase [Paludibacterium purpuratum]|uniref:PAS domain S-box-containing protein/diguanylate cyclase (GGDEF)-like protein n=1 Tax=Paludibacterium purpuratum TaxID=1144873 RepID=A0A4R7BA83_9NEIS|nr:EAL domain-containing protein [Paludibacterium purpuratum]TDR80537.1 PAS domain S-box-containing protein/diguanylate cyclase (GGDEF)-like protein [Paludibacterium purpuratum]